MYKIPVPVQESQTIRLRHALHREGFSLRESFEALEVPPVLRRASRTAVIMIFIFALADTFIRF